MTPWFCVNTSNQYPPGPSPTPPSQHLKVYPSTVFPEHHCPQKSPSPSTSSVRRIFWATSSVDTPFCLMSPSSGRVCSSVLRWNFLELRNLRQGYTSSPALPHCVTYTTTNICKKIKYLNSLLLKAKRRKRETAVWDIQRRFNSDSETKRTQLRKKKRQQWKAGGDGRANQPPYLSGRDRSFTSPNLNILLVFIYIYTNLGRKQVLYKNRKLLMT